MPNDSPLLGAYPKLASVVGILDRYLSNAHPDAFSNSAIHPFLTIKSSKVIHDNLWGTSKYYWPELALIDSPVLQRLRDIHQTGLAYHVYPSAHHSRFEHTLGVVVVASRIFDAIVENSRGELDDILTSIWPGADINDNITRLKQELRLAALLHDTGHSLYSHTSEKVYSSIRLLNEASDELSKFTGKRKGAGEVISFCICLTNSIRSIIDRARAQLKGTDRSKIRIREIDLTNVALMIVGRSAHPFLQFMGDIISSGFDADKLDYLLRDAQAAGLPLRYDVDRYMYDVAIRRDRIADGEDRLKQLYEKADSTQTKRKETAGQLPYYDTYRLRLSRRAMNVVEQIVICKMMLFSYIYHHGKSRASEGLLERLLTRKLQRWLREGRTDEEMIIKFMSYTDASIAKMQEIGSNTEISYAYRIANRYIPREVYSLSGPVADHAPGEILNDFLLNLHDPQKKMRTIEQLEEAMGDELLLLKPSLGSSWREALDAAGVWVDAPSAPRFEDIDAVVAHNSTSESGMAVAQLFPVREWTDAYEHYRYQVRIFAFSEHWDDAKRAAKTAMKKVIGIASEDFYEAIERQR